MVLALLLTGAEVFAPAVAASVPFRPYDGPKPLAVWVQRDPWLWVIGSDTPRAVLYEDGELVFARVTGRRTFSYRHRRLGHDELEAFKKVIASAVAVRDLPKRFVLTERTDQPETLLYAQAGDREVAVAVYGMTAQDAVGSEGELGSVPDELLALHRRLATIGDAGSAEWQPRLTEVMVWPSMGTMTDAIKWPSEWPGLKSERTVQRHDGQYSIYLDAALAPKLATFLSRRKEHGGVELDGKVWSMQPRPVFPSEPVWRVAFNRAAP
ncbi:MAG TPA: hypothetical protein VK989_19565 [Polyangia bacterium]|nr:hypothetical protein [Polyangia bacterium]